MEEKKWKSSSYVFTISKATKKIIITLFDIINLRYIFVNDNQSSLNMREVIDIIEQQTNFKNPLSTQHPLLKKTKIQKIYFLKIKS